MVRGYQEQGSAPGQDAVGPSTQGVGLGDRLRFGGADMQQVLPLVVGKGRGPILDQRAVQVRHARTPPREATITSSSARVGMASAQASLAATTAPAALAYSAICPGSQPESRPCTRAPPNASPAPSPQTTSTGCGGTTVIVSRVATRTPSPPILTRASCTPLSRSRRAASCGSAVPTATSTSARFPTTTLACSMSLSYSARAS